ncbi:MAG TPA: hypothetical protein VKA26_03860 [Ignavibacteriaceae bacterium]|nr:hypothetical protein [Ignavibacteriaceae bacterium]
MGKISKLFSEGSNPKSVIIFYVTGVIFIITSFYMGISNNPPGIIVLLLGIFILLFPSIRRRKQRKTEQAHQDINKE